MQTLNLSGVYKIETMKSHSLLQTSERGRAEFITSLDLRACSEISLYLRLLNIQTTEPKCSQSKGQTAAVAQRPQGPDP